MLTEEDKEMMEKVWVGKTGEKRKVEVRIACLSWLPDAFV